MFDHRSDGMPLVGQYFGDWSSGAWSRGFSMSVTKVIEWRLIHFRMDSCYKSLSWMTRR